MVPEFLRWVDIPGELRTEGAKWRRGDGEGARVGKSDMGKAVTSLPQDDFENESRQLLERE
ncbi:hypothetical protein CFI11_03160 [Thalassococcus sp. S3]|nr:hypothetical protein CFI11_03160 [Thalassococcus sp. S3]